MANSSGGFEEQRGGCRNDGGYQLPDLAEALRRWENHTRFAEARHLARASLQALWGATLSWAGIRAIHRKKSGNRGRIYRC